MKLMHPREAFTWIWTVSVHWKNQHISRSRLQANQRSKFRRLATFVYDNSLYYRRVMDDLHIDPHSCSPLDFPIITKADLVEHFDEIVTDPRLTRDRVQEFLDRSTDPEELLDGQFHVLHTSGTSGRVGYFVYSHNEWIKGSCHIVRLTPLRFRRRIAYVAATNGHFAGVSLILTGNYRSNAFFYNVRPFDVNTPLVRLIESLNEFQPQVLSGYAASLEVLARAQEEGQLRIRPKLISSGGEPLTPTVKSRLASAFHAPVADVYASSEHLFMGIHFPEHDGMYLLEDDLMFEIHDNYTCVTNLYNYTTPLIRYRMDDVLIPDATGPRILPFTKVREVIGRYEDALVFQNEHGEDDFIHPLVIVEFLVRGLNAWQIMLIDKTSFVFRAQFDPDLTEEGKHAAWAGVRDRMQAILTNKEMRNVQFDIQEVHYLSIDQRSGKFRLIVPNDGSFAPSSCVEPVRSLA
jgi:phenylacetate-CoA ligase